MRQKKQKTSTYLINHYEKVTKPQVIENSDIYTFLEYIKNPDQEFITTITHARELCINGKKREYDQLKMQQPCCTLNFTFSGYKNNNNIIGATGFMFIDIDNSIEIDLSNPYLFATWKSFSNTGRGVLVAIDGLTQENFQANYLYVTELLNIKADKNAAKATQFTIYSYDKNIYINDNSKIIKAKESSIKINDIRNKKMHNRLAYKKRIKDVNVLCNIKIKYDIYDELDFEGKDYIVFNDDKEYFPVLYIPWIINVGQRNTKISAIAEQFLAINYHANEKDFRIFMNFINGRCEEPLGDDELEGIINRKLQQDRVELIYNKPRRIVFDPYSVLNKKQKQKIVGQVIGQVRIKNSINKIKEAIDNWDFEKQGKITRKSISKATGLHRNTISNRIEQFLELISKMNDEYKNSR
ncbi:hypothetical protein [Pseudofulvibacter geojedonensis]|uniref:Virulence-protein E N-terminal domain-containing protein n=1 Tax=Pseudofulvibacter geojedonensis TaxID=1123758 RepID=A0ABW3I1U9_9FLAO